MALDCTENYIHPALGEASELQEKAFNLVEPYTDGKTGLDIGCGGWKVPGSIAIDLRPGVADIVGDIRGGLTPLLEVAGHAGKRWSYIVSSHLIEDFDEATQMRMCREWLEYLAPGGHLILYVPEKGQFTGTNCCHVREFERGDMERMFEELGLELIMMDYESAYREGGYGVLGVARMPE